VDIRRWTDKQFNIQMSVIHREEPVHRDERSYIRAWGVSENLQAFVGASDITLRQVIPELINVTSDEFGAMFNHAFHGSIFDVRPEALETFFFAVDHETIINRIPIVVTMIYNLYVNNDADTLYGFMAIVDPSERSAYISEREMVA